MLAIVSYFLIYNWCFESCTLKQTAHVPLVLEFISRGKCVKVAQDLYYHYVCIYLKSMHELRRLKPATIEIFMRKYFLTSLYRQLYVIVLSFVSRELDRSELS